MKKLLMIAGVVLAAKLTTQACDCVSPPVDKAFEKAAAVFAGTVQDVRDDRQSGVKIVTLTVEQAWKGLAADQKTVMVETASSGKHCGYEFQEKINYLVYAYGESKSLRTGECSRTCPLANAEEDLVFLTGDAATAKKIRTTAVPLPAPAPQAPTPAPPGLTVAVQENGSVVAAVHTSGKTMWQVKLPAPATAARVEGNQVIVEPSALVLDLASGKAAQQPVAGLAPDQEVAAERAQLLKENAAEFVFHLRYYGSEDKPFYRLTIAGPAAAKGIQSDTFHPVATIDQALVGKLIDHLASEGFLNDAGERKAGAAVAPVGPCYQLAVGPTKTGLEFAQEIPLGEPLVKRLQAIRQVLIAGEKPGPGWQELTGGGWLCADCQNQPRNDQPGKCGSCGGDTASGMLHFCAACSVKYQRCARCSRLQAGPAASGLDQLITRLAGPPNLESTNAGRAGVNSAKCKPSP